MKRITVSLGIIMMCSFSLFSQGASQSSDPPDGLSPLEAYSLFQTSFKNGDYEFALKYGRWFVESGLRTIEGYKPYNLPRQYERMITIYEELGKTFNDPTIRSAYVDTALSFYDRALTTFTDEEIDKFNWRFEKARFHQKNADIIADGLNKAFEMYEVLLKEEPEKVAQIADGYYVQMLLQFKISLGKEEAMEFINFVEPFADPKTASMLTTAKASLFSSPEERIQYLETEILPQNPNDISTLEELAKLYKDIDNRGKVIELTRKLHTLHPSFEYAKTLGDIAKGNANSNEAIKLYKEAIELAPGNSEKEVMALNISEVYQNMERLQDARQFARQALQYNPNSGRAYIRIANIYGTAVQVCTSSRKLELNDRIVYWLVLDYLDKAKRVDPSVSNLVRQYYNTYEPVLPTSENKFFANWEGGETLKVDKSIDACYDWIGETTKVR